jgi:hypothetical protein
MINKRVKISSIVSSQLPRFVREDYPLLSQFLTEYYNSLDGRGLTNDILQNIDQYFKLDNLVNLTEQTNLASGISFNDTTINVITTAGFPDNDGLIRIDDEIIYYKSKTEESFTGCIRGFSGITSYENGMVPGELTFSTSVSTSHQSNAAVQNLSILFLKQFFKKIKKQILPGFENLDFYSDSNDTSLDQKNFITNAKDFYSTKGTDASFDILFKALYGDPAIVIKPRDFLIRPSDSEYSVTKDIVVESISGNPLNLYNRTLFQTEFQGFKETFATVTKVEEIIKDNITYFILSLDFDYDKDINVRGSIFGDFSIHPKTKCLEQIEEGSNQIIVDSTIGFPNSGELIVKGESGNDILIQYKSKNTTQFLGCSNITENVLIGEDINLNVYAYSKIEDEEIRVRILGVVKDIQLPKNTKYFEPGETISFNTLGKEYKDFKFNHWIVDVPNTYQVLKFENESPTEIRVYTKEIAHINPFDNVHIEFFDSVTEQVRTEVFSVRSVAQDRKSIFVGNPYNIGTIYHVRKLIKKYITLNSNETIVNNIQNIYGDNLDNVYVTSQGIPDYVSPDIEKRNFSIDLYGLFQKIPESSIGIDCEINNATFSIDISVYKTQVHDFRNGDAVRYVQNESKYTLSTGKIINLNLYDGLNQNQIYYVQNISGTQLKLYRSRSNIYFSQYSPIKYNRVVFPKNLNSSTVTESEKIEFLIDKYFFQSNEFVFLFDGFNNFEVWYYSYPESVWEKIDLEIRGKLYKEEYLLDDAPKNLKDTNNIKKISSPQTPVEIEETRPGNTGILVNGVEILNYKSEDFVYYGPIEKIEINSPGEGYDVINLPTLGISTETTNPKPAVAYVEVTGKLEKVDVIDGGFDYIDEPIITITGGNGTGAEAKANLVTFKHEVDIIPIPKFIDLTNNIISFSTYHKFRDYEKVIYDTNGNPSIGGISTLSEYYVTVINDTSVKLHKNENDAIAGVAINLTSYGSGAQKLVAKEEKRKISSVTIVNPGENYRNNYITIRPVGINTYNGTITAINHGYKTGDIVDYSCTGSYPRGLPKSNYYVTTIDENNFKLSPIGVGQTSKDYYYRTNQYSEFSTTGIGTHIFKHDPIKLTVSGKTGISSYSKLLFDATLSPVFRGSISNVYIQNGGTGYGSAQILNYEKQPTFELISSGKDARFYVNVLDGKITDVYVINSGSNYYGIPDLVVRGSGIGCVLSPKVVDGKITEVFVVNGGSGYDAKNTVIDIINYGKNASFQAKIRSWNINLVSRIFNSNNLLSPDDGFLYAKNDNLKYSHLYCPSELRKKIYSQFIDSSGNLISRPDYDNSTSTTKYHSPIIGWAYDGNPIYGPYGYDKPFAAGQIRKMISGYELIMPSGRPPQSFGGRTIFPMGIFVEDYYYSGNGDLDECNGRYCVTPEYPNGTYAYFMTVSDDDFEPKFPYIIGKYYKSKTISDNFDSSLNQNNFDYFKNSLIRNTYFYSIDKDYSNYQFLLNPNKTSDQNSKIISTYYSSVNSVGIITSGNNYSVGDRINFINKDTKGFGVDATVETIKGKDIVSIANSFYSISDLELYSLPNNSYIVAIANQIHELNNLDLVNIVGNSNLESSRKINSFVQVGIKSQFLTLTSNVNNSTQTGIVTYFDVDGILDFPYISENDSYVINGEVLKILKIDKNSSKVQVLRSVSGPAHPKNSSLVELTRKFTFLPLDKDSYSIVNREYYFNPIQSIGIGTTSGTLVSVDYIGTGNTTLLIPAKNLYLQNHNLETNVPLVYSPNGGTSVKVSNGSSIFDLELVNPIYTIKFSNDFIGISSNRVSIGTEGTYAGIGTTIPTLSIVDYGNGTIHSFKTNYETVVKARLEKNKVTVSTASSHGLSNYDFVDISVNSGISTTIKIQYVDSRRRLICNEKQFNTVNTIDNIFQIDNHNYYTGEPLLYKSIGVVSPLTNEKIYYAIVVDNNKFKLANTLYDATVLSKEIDIVSSSSGYLYQINPKINVIENQKIIFDLSDSSLSFTDGFDAFSAFDFDLYYDNNFNKKYYHDFSKKINVFKFGRIGLDADARLELNLTKDTPNNLYYNLTPVTNSDLPDRKKQFYLDVDSIENNSIEVFESKYSGGYNIIGINSTQFEYQVAETPEIQFYDSQNADLSYITNSNSATGPINSINVNSGGKYYTKLPGISSITSKYGQDAVLYPISNDIGKIKSTKINEIGCWYSADPTLRPSLVPPKVLRVEPFSTIDEITTTFKGKYYNYSPTLKVIDPSTNIVQDVILDFDYLTGKTKIIKNSSGFNDIEPKIITVNNSNGIGISTIFYDVALKRVTAFLNSEFTNPDNFPVDINDQVLIENISITERSEDFEPDGIDYIGYNSDDYAYNSFTVVGFSTTIDDDAAYITYYIGDYLDDNSTLGTFDSENSRGAIVPVKNIPKFKVKIKKNTYLKGEQVTSNGATGYVENWNPETNYIKIKTTSDFTLESILVGSTSGSIGTIQEVINFDSNYNIDYFSINTRGWQNQTGFLNVNSQRVHDSDYYQYFSYSIKSRIPIDTWKDAVNALNHTAGFKQFSDLSIEPKGPIPPGISTDQNEGTFTGISDLNTVIDLETTYDFDLGSEESVFRINYEVASDEITLNSTILQDYSQSIGNRALVIDDISGEFNTNRKSTFVTAVDI